MIAAYDPAQAEINEAFPPRPPKQDRRQRQAPRRRSRDYEDYSDGTDDSHEDRSNERRRERKRGREARSGRDERQKTGFKDSLTEEERNLGASVLGGAGGAMLGRKLGGGTLGTIGGIVAGAIGASVLEEKHEKYEFEVTLIRAGLMRA